jgi:hypothetical protein
MHDKTNAKLVILVPAELKTLAEYICTRTHSSSQRECVVTSEMDMGWVHPWVGLGWVGLGWVGSNFPAHVMGWVGLNNRYCMIIN